MLKETPVLWRWGFRILDLLAISGSYICAFKLRYELYSADFAAANMEFHIFLAVLVLSWLIFSGWFNLYRSHRRDDIRSEIGLLCKVVGLSNLVAFIPAFFIRELPISRIFLLYFWGLQAFSLILFRIMVRETLKYIRLNGYNYRQVLIVGRNARTEAVRSELTQSPQFGIRVLGVIDSPLPECPLSFHGPVLGKLEDLERILRSYVVDEVIITLPLKSFYEQIETIIRQCEMMGVQAKMHTDLFARKIAKSEISRVGSFEVIEFSSAPKMTIQLMFKRILDVAVSGIALLMLLPLMTVLAIVIKATSAGPIFFAQRRLGYNGRSFTCYKFRTMVANAECLKAKLVCHNEMSGPVFKIKNDPRVTSIGRFLRRTSLDELPQLLNVLRGDMSLVGPRPPIPDEVREYGLADCRRLSMRPGITCIWQISGRNDIQFKQWMEMDQQYIDNWSLWLDLKILWKTIPAVITQRGAL
jgi:exopolysaccharide biosynthesis polyprenyl glycosylphosphotransferase